MRRVWLFLVYGIVSVVVESTLLSNVFGSVIHFNFILMAVIAIAIAEDQRGAIAAVVILGALLDITSSAPFGLAIFSSLIVYGFIRTIVSKITIEIWVARFVWVGLASIVNSLVTLVLFFVWSGNVNVIEVIVKIAGPQALFDAATGLVIIPLVRWYDGLTWEKLFRPKGLVFK